MAAALFPSGINTLDNALKGGFARPSNLLLMGDPLSLKRELGMSMLNAGLQNNEAVIYITSKNTAEEIRARWLDYGLTPAFENQGRVKFVDCYSKMIGSNASDTPSIKRVPSVIDYTKLAVAVNDWCSGYVLKNLMVRILFDSLSTLLIYSSLQTVMRFLHIFLGQLRKQNALGFLIVEEGTHDLLTVNQLKSFSNGALILEANNLRCEGLCAYPMSVPFSFSAAQPTKQALESQTVGVEAN